MLPPPRQRSWLRSRRGESVAVLIGRKQYERLATRSRRFSEAWTEFTAEFELAELAIDPDETFNNLRDTRPGRDVGL